MGETTTALSSKTGPRFFNPAQPHVVESAWYAWAATIIPSQSAKRQSYGMDQQMHPEKASRECWLQQMASRSASTGRSPGAAVRSVTQIDTDAQGAENPTTGLKDALKHRECNPLTPYDRRVVTLGPGVCLDVRFLGVALVLGSLLLPLATQICGKRVFGVM